MNIVYSTSNYFVKPTITSIISLINHNEVTNIIILYSDLSDDSIELIKRIVKKCNIIFLKCDDIIKEKLSHLKLKKVRGNWNTYLRIFIPSLFPEFERILYHTPRPVNILMHPNGLYAFVSNSNAHKIEVIDMKTFKIVSTIGTGRVPDGLTIVN